MAKSLKEIEKTLRDDGMYIWPEDARLSPSPKDKEYIAGHYQCKMGHPNTEKVCFSKRNAAAKFLREEGFQTWTEPRSHMGGSETYEWPLSAMRKK